MTQLDATAEAAHAAGPMVFLINGSGAGMGALIAFLIFAAYMIAREAAR